MLILISEPMTFEKFASLNGIKCLQSLNSVTITTDADPLKSWTEKFSFVNERSTHI